MVTSFENREEVYELFMQAPVGIYLLKGDDYVIEMANEPILALWGKGKGVIGKPVLASFPEVKEQGFMELLDRVRTTGKSFQTDEMAVWYNYGGKKVQKYVTLLYQPYFENGVVTGIFSIATDVTEKVVAKKQLEESEKNLRNLILQSPVAMCIFQGPDYVVEIANARMVAFWGKQDHEVLGKPIFEGLPEARDQGFEDLLRQVYTEGVTIRADERAVVLPRSGHLAITYVNFVYEPLRAQEGKITGVMAVAIEVTDQVIARQKIEEAEERARMAAESAELGSFEVNLVSNEIIASARMNQIMGVVATAERANYISAIHPEDLGIRDAAYQNAFASGKLEYDGRVIWPDGSVHWMRVKGRIFFDQQRPVKMLGVVQDITEQKQFSEELSRQVKERTLQLQAANESLQKSNAELEQFAYVSSHDLQEPLRKIKLFADLIRGREQEKFSEVSRSQFDKIIDAADRMSHSLRDLLAYASLSKEEPWEMVDLNKVLQQVADDLEVLILQKSAQIHYPPMPTVRAIPLQMHQLFYNLLSNALKFSKADEAPVIRIGAKEAGSADSPQGGRGDRAYYQIEVQDNGIGFDPANRDKIFTIFQRLHDRSRYSGTGIGLALCKKVVANHGGEIYAVSAPGEGACFVIRLPVAAP